MLLLHEGPVLRMRHLEERNGRVRTYNALIMRHDVYHSAATWIFLSIFLCLLSHPGKNSTPSFFLSFAVQEPGCQHLPDDGDPEHQDGRVPVAQNSESKVTQVLP